MKSLLVVIAMLNCLPSIAQKEDYYGPVKISFYGFVCNRATNDDAFGMDGVGDEVVVHFSTWQSVFDNRSNFSTTKSYGEDFLLGPDRVKAGSSTINGGLKAGDRFLREGVTGDNEPGKTSTYAILTGFCSQNTVVVIAPGIWEVDKDAVHLGPIQSHDARSRQAFNDVALRQRVWDIEKNYSYNDNVPISFIQPGQSIGLDAKHAGAFQSTRNKNGSRPIGLGVDWEYRSQVLLLNSKTMMLISQKDFGYGIGILPVQYNEESLGNAGSHGNYTILLKIVADIKKREPVGVSQPVKPMVTTINTTRPVLLHPNTNIARPAQAAITEEFISGVWTGTMGTGTANTGTPFIFRFYSQAFWVLNANGSSSAVGTYQLGTWFTASYTDANNNNYTISMEGYNAATKELLGNWSCNGPNNYRNSGKWIAKKTNN